jgi:hypothetical protein
MLVSGATGVPREYPSLPSPFEIGLASPDEVDPELLALPDPPRTGRRLAVVVLAAGAVAALAMALLLRQDVLYALGPSNPSAVGDLRVATDAALSAHDNGFVRAEGLLGAAGIRYERPLREDTFRALPIVGRAEDDAVWVEVRVPPGQESGRWEPPRSFVGRLTRFDAVGPRHRGIARAIEETTHVRVGPSAFLLVDGEEPGHGYWAIVLAAMFLGFAAWNALALARLVRRVK